MHTIEKVNIIKPAIIAQLKLDSVIADTEKYQRIINVRRVITTGPVVLARAVLAIHLAQTDKNKSQAYINSVAQSLAARQYDCWWDSKHESLQRIMPVLLLAGQNLIKYTTGKGRDELYRNNKKLDSRITTTYIDTEAWEAIRPMWILANKQGIPKGTITKYTLNEAVTFYTFAIKDCNGSLSIIPGQAPKTSMGAAIDSLVESWGYTVEDLIEQLNSGSLIVLTRSAIVEKKSFI